jgi:hypothetical protein
MLNMTHRRLTRRCALLAVTLACFGSPLGIQARPAPSLASVGLVRNQELPTFESEALANRALHYRRPFSTRLRAFFNRWYSRSTTGGGNVTASGAARKRPTVELSQAQPDKRPESHDSRPSPAEEFGVHEVDWNVPRLHAASIEILECLNMLASFGALQPPWIKDVTGQLGAAPSLAETTAVLRREPRALVLLRWSLPEAPLEARLLHQMMGDVLPLRRSAKLELLRQHVRDIRVIWVTTSRPNELPVSEGLRQAAAELLTLDATFKRIREMDPSLAILAGADEESVARWRRDVAFEDFGMVEDALEQAEDLAAWEGDGRSAIRLAEEAERFSELRIGSVTDTSEKERYQRLSLQASRMRSALAGDLGGYAAEAREATWQHADSTAHHLLKSTIGDQMIVQVPGEAISVVSPADALEVMAYGLGPQDRHRWVAPWLYGIEVAVVQPVGDDYRDETLAMTGLPIAVVDAVTGTRHVSRLRHDAAEISDSELSVAAFLNLSPGIYRVEVVSPPPRDPPAGPGTRLGGPNVPRAIFSLRWLRIIMTPVRRPRTSTRRTPTNQHSSMKALGTAA